MLSTSVGATILCGALAAFTPAHAFDPMPSEVYAKPQILVPVEGAAASGRPA